MNLKYVMRCINESMRLYPHPPVLLRRALVEDTLPGEACRGGPPATSQAAADAHRCWEVLLQGVAPRPSPQAPPIWRACACTSFQIKLEIKLEPVLFVCCPFHLTCAGGYTVPANQDVMISVYNIHRSPAGKPRRRLGSPTVLRMLTLGLGCGCRTLCCACHAAGSPAATGWGPTLWAARAPPQPSLHGQSL